jgi:hypothetical protein
MKKRSLLTDFNLILCIIAIFSCKNEHSVDPNQPAIDQMKAVTYSIFANTEVPGIIALVADHKRGFNWLYTAGVSDKIRKAPMDSNYKFRS